MDTAALWAEITQQRVQLGELHERIGVLEEETDSMRRTIDTVLRLKCKRGEGAFALNTDLMTCVQKNTEFALKGALKQLGTAKTSDIVADFIVAVLIGPDQEDIPCAVLDTNTFVYKNNNLWIAASLTDFSETLSDNMSDIVALAKKNPTVPLTDDHVLFYNSLIQTQPFLGCVKKAMKIYKDL